MPYIYTSSAYAALADECLWLNAVLVKGRDWPAQSFCTASCKNDIRLLQRRKDSAYQQR